MKESTLKNWVFWTLFFGKIIIAFCILVKWKSGGLPDKDAAVAATAILPLFSANIALIFKDFIKNRELKEKEKAKLVKKSLLPISLAFIVLYVLSFVFVILLRSQGVIKNIMAWVNSIESIIGIYVVILVQSLFSEEKKENS